MAANAPGPAAGRSVVRFLSRIHSRSAYFHNNMTPPKKPARPATNLIEAALSGLRPRGSRDRIRRTSCRPHRHDRKKEGDTRFHCRVIKSDRPAREYFTLRYSRLKGQRSAGKPPRLISWRKALRPLCLVSAAFRTLRRPSRQVEQRNYSGVAPDRVSLRG